MNASSRVSGTRDEPIDHVGTIAAQRRGQFAAERNRPIMNAPPTERGGEAV